MLTARPVAGKSRNKQAIDMADFFLSDMFPMLHVAMCTN